MSSKRTQLGATPQQSIEILSSDDAKTPPRRSRRPKPATPTPKADVVDLITPSPPPVTRSRSAAVQSTGAVGAKQATAPKVKETHGDLASTSVSSNGKQSTSKNANSTSKASDATALSSNRAHGDSSPQPQIKISPKSEVRQTSTVNLPTRSSKSSTTTSKLSPQSPNKRKAGTARGSTVPANGQKSPTPSSEDEEENDDEDDVRSKTPPKKPRLSPEARPKPSTRSQKTPQGSSSINSSSPLITRLQSRKGRGQSSSARAAAEQDHDSMDLDLNDENLYLMDVDIGENDHPVSDRNRGQQGNTQQPQATDLVIIKSLHSLDNEIQASHAATTRMLLQDAREVSQRMKNSAVENISPFGSLSSVQADPAARIPKGHIAETMDSWVQTKLNKTSKSKSVHLAIKILTDVPRVPRYNAHTNVSYNILIADNEKLKYVPYMKEVPEGKDKKPKNSTNDKEFRSLMKDLHEFWDTRKPESPRESEKAHQVRPFLERWLAEGHIDLSLNALIHFLLGHKDADLGLKKDQQQLLLSAFDEPLTDSEKETALMFWDSFEAVFEVELTNVVLPVATLKEMESALKPVSPSQAREPTTPGARVSTFTTLTCLICGGIDCPTHADYTQDEITEVGVDEGKDSQNVAKFTTSVRQPIALPYQDALRRFESRKISHDDDGRLQSSIEVSEPCGEECWLITDYDDRDIEWNREDLKLMHELLVPIDNPESQACKIAKALALPCWQIHAGITAYMMTKNITKEVEEPTGRPKRPDWYDNKKKILSRDFQEMTKAHLQQERTQANPCTHEGHCTTTCPCYQTNILCESFCGCPPSCPRRFTGCACLSNGLNCVTETCICIQMNRECGPECSSCGATERINPSNQHNTTLFHTGCQNIALQRHEPIRTVVGESQLEGVGFGLYVAEDAKKGDFLGEYTGEVISSIEAERRGILYDRKLLSFLFDLNADYVIDAARLGNYTRFINHADNTLDGLNCEAQVKLVNGEHRIKFFALRDIAAGEELLFNYGQKFAEKHGLNKTLPKGGKKGVVVGQKALDALDGLGGLKDVVVGVNGEGKKVGAKRGRPKGSRNRVSSRKEAVRKVVTPEPEVVEDDGGDEDEESEEDNSLVAGREKRTIVRPKRYTR